MNRSKAQSTTEILRMKDLELQADNTLISYARYRTPKIKSWISNLYPYTPGFLKSTRRIQRHDGETNSILLRLLGLLYFGFQLFLFSVPYIFLLLGTRYVFSFFFSEPFLDTYTILFMVYCGVTTILFMFNYHKLLHLIRANESRKYIERQGVDYTYNLRYFSLIIAFFSIVTLPILFVLIFSDSLFVSEISIDIVTEFFFFIALSLIFFCSFNTAAEWIGAWENFSTSMSTSFGYEDINVKGSILGEKYNMVFSIKDIDFFAILKIQDPAWLSGTDMFLPRTRDFEGVTQLYIINKYGFANLCSYYIQGEEAAQELLAFLTKQYPGIDVRPIGFDNKQETEDVLSKYRPDWPNASFDPFYGIRTPFFFPRFVNLKKDRSNNLLPDSSPEEVSNVAITGIVNRTNNDDMPSSSILKKASNHNNLYLLKGVIAISVCFLLMVVTIFFCPLIVTSFSFLMACFSPFLPPGKRWYRPGVNSIPAFLILLLLILGIML